MKHRIFMSVAGLMLAGAVAVNAWAERDDDEDHDEGSGSYAIGLWGDLPYSDVQATVGVPNLIADMNASGSRSRCTTATSRPATARPVRPRRQPAATRSTCRRSAI